MFPSYLDGAGMRAQKPTLLIELMVLGLQSQPVSGRACVCLCLALFAWADVRLISVGLSLSPCVLLQGPPGGGGPPGTPIMPSPAGAYCVLKVPIMALQC